MDSTIIELEKETGIVAEEAFNRTIVTQDDYNLANAFVVNIKRMQKKVKDTFEPIIAKAYAAHKEAKNQESIYMKPLLKAEEAVKAKMCEYITAQERARAEAERKLQEAADKERAAAIAKADAARAAGKEAQAAKYEAKAAQVVAPVLAPSVDKGSAQLRTTWRAEVVDVVALCRAVVDGKVPTLAVEANMTFLNQQARSMKGQLNYPGVKSVEESSVAIRTGA